MKILPGLSFSLTVMSLFAAPPVPVVYSEANWKQLLAERIPLYGHRNWIVVADSAYPAQSASGIETIVSNADHLQVLREVLSQLSTSRHITPIVNTDQELGALEEADAPGISSYRQQLTTLLHGQRVNVLPHETLINNLDQVSRTFRVLIIKTNMALPYTSVFLQLDCKYWGPDSERRLRSAIAEHARK